MVDELLSKFIYLISTFFFLFKKRKQIFGSMANEIHRVVTDEIFLLSLRVW